MPRAKYGKWEVHPYSLFRIYQSPAERVGRLDRPLKALFLLQVSESGRAEDSFRFSVEGPEILEAEAAADEILDHKAFRPFLLKTGIRPDDLELRRNATSSAWMDLDVAVEEGLIQPHAKAGGALAREAFLAAWMEAKEADPHLGGAFRWAILATAGGLKLEWQGMPASAGQLKKDPRTAGDSCPAVGLASFEVEANMELDEPRKGPIPVLFSRNEVKAAAALARDPELLTPGKFELGIVKLKFCYFAFNGVITPLTAENSELRVRKFSWSGFDPA